MELVGPLGESGRLLTYSSAFPVRGAMLKNGLHIAETEAFGRKRGGTACAVVPLPDLAAVPEKEYDIIRRSTAGVPYNDPGMRTSPKVILERHRKVVERLRRRSVPKWYRAERS